MSCKLPYNPAAEGPQVHDRRAKTVSRGSINHIVETEVDDPYEFGARISAVRSVRDDPLGRPSCSRPYRRSAVPGRPRLPTLLCRGGERPQGDANRRGGGCTPIRETLTDEQLKAGKWLTKCYGALGKDGSTLIHEMLISNRSTRQIACSSGHDRA